jgi:hypothetical protein
VFSVVFYGLDSDFAVCVYCCYFSSAVANACVFQCFNYSQLLGLVVGTIAVQFVLQFFPYFPFIENCYTAPTPSSLLLQSVYI